MLIGYARTSTTEQAAGLEAQVRDLRAAGAQEIHSEQVSSVAHREVLEECLKNLKSGDVLMVTKPDRLARSTANLLSIVEDLTKRSIGLVLLSMGGERLDTRNPTSKLILTILAGVATWERDIMLERQQEGIARAKAGGKYVGRKRTIDRTKVLEMAAEIGPESTARELGIAQSSVYLIMADSRNETEKGKPT